MLTLVMAIRRRWSLPPQLPAQPGHWLLAIIGGGYLGAAILFRTVLWMHKLSNPHPTLGFVAGAGIVAGVVVLLFSAFLVLTAIDELWPQRPWRLAFQLLGSTLLSLLFVGCCIRGPFSGSDVFVVPTGVLLLTLITAAFAASGDLLQGERRDLLHWLGVGAFFAVVAHVVALILLLWPK